MANATKTRPRLWKTELFLGNTTLSVKCSFNCIVFQAFFHIHKKTMTIQLGWQDCSPMRQYWTEYYSRRAVVGQRRGQSSTGEFPVLLLFPSSVQKMGFHKSDKVSSCLRAGHSLRIAFVTCKSAFKPSPSRLNNLNNKTLGQSTEHCEHLVSLFRTEHYSFNRNRGVTGLFKEYLPFSKTTDWERFTYWGRFNLITNNVEPHV